MSEPNAETENSQPAEQNGSPATANATPVDEDEPAAEPAKADKAEKPKGDPVAAAFAVNGLDEPRRTSTKPDMPSLELSDNEFNSTDSDSFAGRAQKNRTLELKLSAIIEKACSSDFEVEDLPAAQPLPASNVTVMLPNNQLLFTVEGVDVSAAAADQSLPQPPAKKAPTRRKKYVYKLKSKGGTVLTYTSYTPVVLKKPRINLTRVEVGAIRAKRKAPSGGTPANGKRGKGQPPKTASLPAPVDDAAANQTNSSFGMRTRKRKLKFRPDGRLECVAKRRRSSSSSISDDKDSPPPKESTDEDWEATGDDLRMLSTRLEEKVARSAKRKPATKAQTPRSAKVAKPKSARRESPQQAKPETPKSPNAKMSVANNAAAGRAVPAAKPSVNPAQLLSTLLGVTIRPNQLNTVRFKPKSFQKQHGTLQKTILMSSDELKKAVPRLDKAITPKPLMQKILPKSSLASIFNKTDTIRPSTPSMLSMALSGDLVSPTAPTCAEPPEAALEVPNFDHFTDSRTVRTKGGPKKWLLQNLPELGDDGQKLNRLTVYDLAQNVFDRMPTWNLHIMPDTNTFCIAQVGRGRMGIPILKKSVELNDNFAAKIFVHQLHCKKFDGIYDTEAKINSLIAEINSLAA